MARFNEAAQTKSEPDTKNREGVPAYERSPKMRFASLVLTNMMKDQFYRSADMAVHELRDLLGEVSPLFAAQAAVLTRHEYGLRSISHVLAAELAPLVSGKEWGTQFYEDVAYRPDDVTEILAYFQSNVAPSLNGTPAATAAMKKGLGYALTKFDEYQLDKYAQRRKAISLHDAVNILHPPETEAIAALVNGTIARAETWEKEMSDAGEVAERSERQVWAELLEKDKLGLFATLRNLRNIAQDTDSETVEMATEVLMDSERVKQSKVLPFNFTKAYDAIREAGGIDPHDREQIDNALTLGVEASLSNVPKFEGTTAVLVDVSSSMHGDAIRHASLFGAVLYKATEGSMILYNSDAEWANFSQAVPTLTIVDQIRQRCSGSTDCPAAFRLLAREGGEVDRIVVLTDNQSWSGRVARGDNVKKAFENYRNQKGVTPTLYNFDLQGYGSLQMPEDEVLSVAGFSPKVFDTMRMFEDGTDAIIEQIENVDLPK